MKIMGVIIAGLICAYVGSSIMEQVTQVVVDEDKRTEYNQKENEYCRSIGMELMNKVINQCSRYGCTPRDTKMCVDKIGNEKLIDYNSEIFCDVTMKGKIYGCGK